MTAVPISHMWKNPHNSSDIDIETLRNSVCFSSVRSYHKEQNQWTQSFFAYGGRSRMELEMYTITECEKKFTGRVCIPVLYNHLDVCNQSFDSTYQRLMSIRSEARLNQQIQQQQQQDNIVAMMRQNCIRFGFRENTNELNSCVMEMYRSQQEIESIRNAAKDTQNAIAAQNSEAQRIREFEQSMRLLQLGAGMMTPQQRETTTCTYDPVMRMMRCR
jgi:hypothetical protein